MDNRKIGFDPNTKQIDYLFHEKIIKRFTNVPTEEWNFLKLILGVRSFKKGTHLLKEGVICDTLYYVIKGGARFYYVNRVGDEVTYNFIFENNFIVAFASLFTQSPSAENIILLEDTVVFTLHYDDFQKLLNRHPVWQTLLNKLVTKHFLRISEKEKMLLLDNYDSRYLKLMETRPYLFQRVEQQHIASYLGMTPETLSRIKKRVFLK